MTTFLILAALAVFGTCDVTTPTGRLREFIELLCLVALAFWWLH